MVEGASNGLHDDEITNGSMYNSGMGLGLKAILDMLLFPHVKFAVHGCVTKRTAWDTRLISLPGRLDAIMIALTRQFPCFVRLRYALDAQLTRAIRTAIRVASQWVLYKEAGDQLLSN
jgi:hypothetical protein